MINAKTWNPAQIDQAIRRLEGIIRSGSYNPAELNQLLNQLGEPGYINTWNPAELDQKLRTLLHDLLSWKTTTGNPIQLRTNNGGLVQSCEVTFSPIQSGSGNPAPDNIRPIIGRDSLILNQAEKNMSIVNLVQNVGWAESNNDLLNVFNSLPIGNYILSFGVKVNSVIQSVNSWSYGITGVVDGVEYRYRKTVSSTPTINYTDNANFTLSITSENVGKFTALYLYGCGNNQIGKVGESDITNIQIEHNSTATPYEPYNGQTHTATFYNTVYGGNHEFVSGKLTSEWAYIASYDGETITEPWISSIDAYVPGTTPSTGAEVCYKLATPTTITLTPEDIELLAGDNVLWTDGDNIEITYKKLLLPSDVESLSKIKKIEEKPKTKRSKKKKEE